MKCKANIKNGKIKPLYALSFDEEEVYIDKKGEWWLNHTRDTKLLLFRNINQMEKFIKKVKKEFDIKRIKRIEIKIGMTFAKEEQNEN